MTIETLGRVVVSAWYGLRFVATVCWLALRGKPLN